MSELMVRLLPVFILLVIGFISRKSGLFRESFVDGLKTLIVKIALPAVLFNSFSTMELQLSYLLLFAMVFLYCALLYGLGNLLHRVFPSVFGRLYTKGFMTGFEFGMIGVGLFGAIWGMDKLPVIMLIGFGHELFIWFCYVPLISANEKEKFNLGKTVMEFLKTPTIAAILIGVAVNLLGLYPVLEGNVIGKSVLETVGLLTPLTSPLILIVIGYNMSFARGGLKEITAYLSARILLTLGIGTLVFFLINSMVHGLDPLFTEAFYAFLLLPAPYILPLFISEQEEAAFFTQLLVYSTLLTFIGYGVLAWFSAI
ncbi:MAG TPA: hypothetical protein PLU43_10015 [Lachnospiraceae bacterium]|nr:hypothetical protein [Lachnospiraceae bacterium]